MKPSEVDHARNLCTQLRHFLKFHVFRVWKRSEMEKNLENRIEQGLEREETELLINQTINARRSRDTRDDLSIRQKFHYRSLTRYMI